MHGGYAQCTKEDPSDVLAAVANIAVHMNDVTCHAVGSPMQATAPTGLTRVTVEVCTRVNAALHLRR